MDPSGLSADQRAAASHRLPTLLHAPTTTTEQVTGSLLDDDTHYSRCDPLLFTSPNATTWDFRGVRPAMK